MSHSLTRIEPVARSLFCLVMIALVLGCRGESKPRSIEEINNERISLPALFQTPSGKQIEAPGNQGIFVDTESNEIAWPVYECTNPDCPGRSTEGKPHLFIWSDPRFYADDNGEIAERQFENIQDWRLAVKESGGHREPTCEHCLKIRNIASETPDDTLEFSLFVQKHVLPATAERRKQLDAEHQTRVEYINKRMGKGEGE